MNKEYIENHYKELIEYIKHHLPIIIQFDDKGWCNANIKYENGKLIVMPDNNILFDD